MPMRLPKEVGQEGKRGLSMIIFTQSGKKEHIVFYDYVSAFYLIQDFVEGMEEKLRQLGVRQ